MLSSPEERRRQRHEKAKQRKSQRKKLYIRLGAAGAVLIFCLVLEDTSRPLV